MQENTTDAYTKDYQTHNDYEQNHNQHGDKNSTDETEAQSRLKLSNSQEQNDEKKQSRASLKNYSLETAHKLVEPYVRFLQQSPTVMLAVDTIERLAKEQGFDSVDLSPSKFIIKNMDGTALALVKKGKRRIIDGVRIIGAHLDSPCLTGKSNPVRQKAEGVCLDCYPYGGIYPHQWFDSTVSVYGHCIKNAKRIDWKIPGIVADATIHLSAAKRTTKPYDDAFDAESLDVFVGFDTEEKLYQHLQEKGVTKDDFFRTHITVVPSQEPFYLSEFYLAGFGQDDKACAYAQLQALFSADCEYTSIALFLDREEIGSTGYSGANAQLLEHVMDVACEQDGFELSDVMMRRIFAKSFMISADVDVAYNSHDETYSQKESAVGFGDGISIDRFNGGKNQSFGNIAPLTTIDAISTLFSQHNVAHKVAATPPKVNTGGGGTIGMYFAHRGIVTIDMGIPVMNMHGKHSIMYIPDFLELVSGFKLFFEKIL